MTVFSPSYNRYSMFFMKLIISKSKITVIFCLLLGLTSCSKTNVVNKINFAPSYKSEILSCETSFTQQNKDWHYQQLQFFISNIAVKNKQGSWHTWLMKKNAFQNQNIALIGENCADKKSSKNKNNHWSIEFSEQLNLHDFTALRFTLGVPFEFNHLNPLTQPSPLNDPSMFWVWQTGHKFLRLELASKTDSWLFHLGSTGCKAPSSVRSPKDQCRQPNRVDVELELPVVNSTGAEHAVNMQNNTLQINFLLDKLLTNVKLNKNHFCQSSPENKTCQILFSSLNLISENTNKKAVFEVNIDE